MNKLVYLFILSVVVGGRAFGQKKEADMPVKNTIAVSPGDSHEEIISKAAHVVPTPNQYQALKNEFIAFIHFGPNAFTRMEWGTGKEDPKIFDLKELHTDQWCEAMKAAGMKMVIITVKHHDGFVLWQSRYTKHGIMSTGFKDGKGDILRELTASCRRYGLKVGIYLSPADLYQIENPAGLYGNLSKYTQRTIPRSVAGRPFTDKRTFTIEADDYNEYFMNQLFELLTEYGPIHEVWFDGAHPKTKGGQQYNYLGWKQIIRTLAPQAVVFGKEDIRWCGNEAGQTRDTEWNVIPYAENPNLMNRFADLTDEDLGSREQLYKAKFLHYQQAETNTSIREGWFYRDDTAQKVRSADDVYDIYERAVGGNSTFLLNIPPNREGKFSPADVASLTEAGKRIRETYGVNLLAKAKGPAPLLDANPESFVLAGAGQPEVMLTTPAPVTINRILLQEAITTHGERVEKHAVDAWVDGAWKEIAIATNIGYKRILRFPDVTATRFRIRILASRATPALSNVSAHYYKSRPLPLQFVRDVKGRLTIEPAQGDFGWNPHGQNAQKNLSADFQIYYTLDGSQPSASSTKYAGPFDLAPGTIKAVAVDKNGTGPVATHTFGLTKANWKLLNVSSEEPKRAAALAFDALEKTYWQSKNDSETPYIAIDLNQEHTLKRFAYTPQTRHPNGMLAKGIVKVSTDGKTWQEVDRFTFGNLVNDPVTRYHTFKQAVQARYVRIEAEEIAGDGKSLAIAELDFFE